MAVDPNATPAGQEPGGGGPQAGTAGTASAEGQEPTRDYEAEIRALRAENAAYRRRAGDAEGKLSQAEQAAKAARDAELSELQREKARADEAEARAAAVEEERKAEKAENALTAKVIKAAQAAKAVDPGTVALLARPGLELEASEEEVEQAVARLLKDKPFLVKPAPSAGSPAAPGGGPAPGQQETDAQKRARIFGGGADKLYDPKHAAEAGGGVIFPNPANVVRS
jgi:hypothetical protein